MVEKKTVSNHQLILVIYKVIWSLCLNSITRSCSDYFRVLDDGSVTTCALGDFSVTFRTCDCAFVNFGRLDNVSYDSSVKVTLLVIITD